MKSRSHILSLCTLAVLSSACINIESALPFKLNSKKSNRVSNQSAKVNQIIGDEKVELQVLSQDVFEEQTSAKNLLNSSHPSAQEILDNLPNGEKSAPSIAKEKANLISEDEESLILGLPMGLIGEQNIFGGVITHVSDKNNQELGGLKLTDLAPLNVRTLITKNENGVPAVTLFGCVSKCDENSNQVPLVSFPVVGLNQEDGMLMLDLAPIGRELNLVSLLDPNGDYTKLKTISSITTSFDYSFSTLVFDVKTKMIPISADPNDTTAPVTEFSVRWYLKLNSAFNPAFTSRSATPGVGFFMTERSSSPKITRFSTTNNGSSVHYYIKNVPAEFQKTFAKALDNWNVEFKKTIGRNLLTYEFVDVNDPRNEELVPGDIRFNIIEWDLNNKAGYGGLGPSIANQFTGETLSANILIQGPTIIELYTKWFGVSEQVRELRANGLAKEANELIKEFNLNMQKKLSREDDAKFALKLGTQLDMNIHSQRDELEDPISKGHFEVVPAGVTYEEYLDGYFQEMLAHELGHNLGLRHNFKGNLGAIEDGSQGSVSRSIMEYLGRPYRHLNAIGIYDKMAIGYGYKGEMPKHLNWFCTDENQGLNNATLATASPECTKSDATSDPFSFWEGRLARVVDLLIDTKSSQAPVWTAPELGGQIIEVVTGLSAYALSAKNTADTWTNFFGKADRPETADGVKNYVLQSLKDKICDPKIAASISTKESAEAQKIALDNLKMLQATIAAKTTSLQLFTDKDLNCQ
jgi:hypothetical protein